MTGQIGILNVGAGDTKLTFDKNNVAETIRAGRIVTDMLRRGYALIIEVPAKGKGGKKTYRRVKAFDPKTSEYIVADFEPVGVAASDNIGGGGHAESVEGKEGEAAAEASEGAAPVESVESPKPKLKVSNRRVSAHATSGVAVARSAGG